MKGWIKLHRSLLEWDWYEDKNTRLMLIHLLVSVNYEDKEYKGVLIPAGSMPFGWGKLAKEVGLSVQETRTAINKLEINKQINRRSTSKGQVVSLVKWGDLQGDDQGSNRQSTSNATGNQQQLKKIRSKKKEITTNVVTKKIPSPSKISPQVQAAVDFYNEQLSANKEHETIKPYYQLVKYLLGDNETKLPMIPALEIKHQLTFDQYLKLRAKEPTSVNTVLFCAGIMLNTPKVCKDKSTIYRSFINWMKK